MLHTASQKPYSFWGRPAETFICLSEFSPFPEYLRLAGLLGLKAKMEALSGNPAGAFEELAAIRSMAKHVRSSPDLISFMYSWAVTKLEHDVMEYVLAHTHSVDGWVKFPVTTEPSVIPSCKAILMESQKAEA